MTVRDATKELFERYLRILPDEDGDEVSLSNLKWMCTTAIKEIDYFPIDKLSRWLGYVQGVMAVKGLISVEAERNFSRPLFHAAYNDAQISIPETKSR